MVPLFAFRIGGERPWAVGVPAVVLAAPGGLAPLSVPATAAQSATAQAEEAAISLPVAVPLFALRVVGERPRASGVVQVLRPGGEVGRRAVPGAAAQLAAVLVEVPPVLAAGKLFVNKLVDGVDEPVQSSVHRGPSLYVACPFL